MPVIVDAGFGVLTMSTVAWLRRTATEQMSAATALWVYPGRNQPLWGPGLLTGLPYSAKQGNVGFRLTAFKLDASAQRVERGFQMPPESIVFLANPNRWAIPPTLQPA